MGHEALILLVGGGLDAVSLEQDGPPGGIASVQH